VNPRALLVASSNRRRGAEVFTESLSAGLSDRGWTVNAVSLASSSDSANADLEPLTSIEAGELGKFRWPVVLALRKRVRSFVPDVVLANGGATLRYGVVATTWSRARLAYVAIGETDYWIRSKKSRILNQILLRRIDAVLAVSRRTQSQLLALEPSLTDRTSVVYTAVSNRFFDLNSETSAGPLKVVMIGSLSAEKDPITALRAVARVPDAVVRFVGGGPLESPLLAEAAVLGASERVELTGSVDDVAPHLQWADVLVLTSLTEGLPGVLLEAGAAGLATVAVDVGGVSEAIVDGVTGVLVPHDVTAIGAALSDLDSDRALVTRMGVAARRHVETNFAMDPVIDRYEAILRGLMT